MKICGLTGGIGMGKSTAAGFLLQKGVRVVDTDEIARELVQPGQPALVEIQDAFGGSVLNANGQLDRAALAGIVFADPVARKKLEDILHPRIRERWLAQIEHWRQEGAAFAVVVIPLLFETQAESFFEKIICVACSATSQMARLNSRGWSSEQIRQRIAAQLPAEQKVARADFVVWTEGPVESHRRQITRIINRLDGAV